MIEKRLVRCSASIAPGDIIRGVQQAYGFLRQLTADELQLAGDPYGRERQAYGRLVQALKQQNIASQ